MGRNLGAESLRRCPIGRHTVSKGFFSGGFGLGRKSAIEVLKGKWLVALCIISAFSDEQLGLSVSDVK